MTKSNKFNAVQFGCGWAAPEGWLNFEASPTLRFERIPVIGRLYTKNANRFPENVVYGDIVKGLPVPPGAVSRLFSSHVLEHLSYYDALQAIANCFALLKPGGIFRVIVPDLKARAERYLAAAAAGDADAANDFMRSTMLGQENRPRSLGAIAASAFGGSEHRWMWDHASMGAALSNAGFVEIRSCAFGDSGDPLFDSVEDTERFIDRGIVEVALQCRRP